MIESPKQWDSFFSGAKQTISDFLKLRNDKGAEPAAVVIARLQKAIVKSDRAREFINSNFWTKDLEPFLLDQISKCAWKPWHPGDPVGDAEVLAEHFFNSGRVAAFKRISDEIKRTIEEGKAAAERLKFEQDRLEREKNTTGVE